MSRYLITLTPLGKYFFGGDMTFQYGSDEKSEFNNIHANFISYIIKSNRFPQQTSLLGMMRYLLLTKSPGVFSVGSQSITNPEGAETLIGPHSFNVIANHDSCNKFGVIEKLSPCFLMRGDEIFLPVPKDYHFKVSFNDSFSEAFSNSRELVLPKLEGYSPKESPDSLYISTTNKAVVKESEIFEKDERIGIYKNYQGQSDNKGFYKQISYKLRDNFCFAFTVDVDFDLTDCHNEIVSIGADGSRFSLSAVEFDDQKSSMPEYPSGIYKDHCSFRRVILLSDSLLTDDDIAKAGFSITNTVPFRFLQFNVTEKNYNLSGGWKKSPKKYYLYEKGSVFYFRTDEDAQAFMESVENKKEFNQIGYNKSQIYYKEK